MTEESARYTLLQPPKPVGHWLFPGSVPGGEIQFHVCRRPCWLHRTMMRVLLGFEWRDVK